MPEEPSKLEKAAETPKEEKPRIDPSVPWYEEHNQEAASKLGVRYSRRVRGYVDSDGCQVLDKFGQPLG
jgi:hypothetical protein